MTITERAIGCHERVVWAADARCGLRAVLVLPAADGRPVLAAVARAAGDDPAAVAMDAMRRAERADLRADVLGLGAAGAAAVIMGGPGRPGARRALRALADVAAGLGGDVRLTPGPATSAAELAAAAGDGGAVAAVGPDAAARGALAAIRGAWGRISDGRGLAGVHVHLRGAGEEARWLGRLLAAAGARISVDDADAAAAAALAREVDGAVVPVAAALGARCDVLAPCTPGLALDVAGVEALACRLVAGPGDDQLACDAVADSLTARGIVWVPDLLAGAGTAVAAAALATGGGTRAAEGALGTVERLAGDVAGAARQGCSGPALLGTRAGRPAAVASPLPAGRTRAA